MAAVTTGIADHYELKDVSFSYQWLLDEVEVADATEASYTVASADRRRAIAVRVSFSDDEDNEVTLDQRAVLSVAAELPDRHRLG